MEGGGEQKRPEILIIVSIGNYKVREVLMKNRTRVWRNVYTFRFAIFSSKKPFLTRVFIHRKFFNHLVNISVKKTADFLNISK